MFSIDSSDLIYRDWSGKCFSTVAPTVPLNGIELFFLGDFFLRNVVAVFDFGANEMRFAARTNDSSSSRPHSKAPYANSAASFLPGKWPTYALMWSLGVAAWI